MIFKTFSRLNGLPFLRRDFFSKFLKIKLQFVGWEQERPISARRARTSYFSSARKNVPSRLNIHARSARDGAFLLAESRWGVLTCRVEMGRSYLPSRDRTFLLYVPTRRIIRIIWELFGLFGSKSTPFFTFIRPKTYPRVWSDTVIRISLVPKSLKINQ